MGNHPSSAAEDRELVEKYKQTGNSHYIGLLFKRHEDMILGVSINHLKHREEARDASMDIFEQLLEKVQDHEINNFKSWLYSLTRNHCLMILRRRKNYVEEELSSEKNEHLFMETPDYEHLDSEAQSEEELLHVALTQLKPNQARCVQLFYLKELSYKEVAQETGFELKKVKSYIQNGKRNLQLILSKTRNSKS